MIFLEEKSLGYNKICMGFNPRGGARGPLSAPRLSGRLFNNDIEMHAVQKQRRQRRRGRPVLTVVSLTRSGASDRIGWFDRSQHAAVTHHRQTAAMGAVPLRSLLILKFTVTLACHCQSSVFPSIFCFHLTCFTHNVYTCNQQTASLS